MAAAKEDNQSNPLSSSQKKKGKKRSLKETSSVKIAPMFQKAKKRKLTDDTKQIEEADITPPEKLKICCFNVNGIRASAKKGLNEYIAQEDADIVCLSETKAKQDQNPCAFEGYQIIWCESDKAGYAGTAILTKLKPLKITRGIGSGVDGQGRALTLEFDSFYLVNCYVPNSGQNLKFKDRRLEWNSKMKQWIQDLQEKKPVIWTGDLNVAILDFDVYDGETNKARKRSAGFTPYERENFGTMSKELALTDAYRHFYPDERKEHYTFFSTRGGMKKQSKGWRLDYFMVSQPLVELLEDVQVQKEKAYSDHVPLVLTMKNPDVALK